jgi:hypothetical protein
MICLKIEFIQQNINNKSNFDNKMIYNNSQQKCLIT